MARITMRKTQETKLSEIFTLYLASAAARGVKDKTLRTYEQHFNAISKRLDVDSNISQITSKDLDMPVSITADDILCGSAVYSPGGMRHCNNSSNSGRILYCNRPSCDITQSASPNYGEGPIIVLQ